MRIRSFALCCGLLCVAAGPVFAQETPAQPALTHEQAAEKLEQLGLIRNHAITSEDILSQVETDQVEAVKLFMAAGVNPDFKDKDGRYPLIVAADSGFTEMVRVLLDAGADVNVKDRFGRTALVVAANGEQDAVFKLLVAANAKP